MPADGPDDYKPKTHAGFGGRRRPPRQSRVTTGGGGDRGRGRDFDGSDGNINPEDLMSWPVPGLMFSEVQAVGERLNDTAPKSPTETLRCRMYNLPDVLTELYANRANLAYLILGDEQHAKVMIGTSVSDVIAKPADRDNPSLSTVLQHSFAVAYVGDQLLSHVTVKSMIEPFATYVGCATGVPAFRHTEGDTTRSEQVGLLLSGLEGRRYGLLVLSVPIPNTYVAKEAAALESQIASPSTSVNREPKIETYLDLLNRYYRQTETGTKIGMWQVCVYYFAPARATFERLESLLRAAYGGEQSGPMPFRTHEIVGLREHLIQFGLVKNQRDVSEVPNTLLNYEFLTPLNARDLSAYVQAPAL